MSVIQKIRDKGGWIMITLIALALIAFILQDRALGGRGNTGEAIIGKVNGTEIETVAFNEKVALMEKMYGAQAGSREQLITGVWEQEVDKIIMDEQYKNLGLTVTGKELTDLLFNPQTSPLKREFTDQATGAFKVEEAKAAFAQIKKSKNAEQIETINEAYINPTVQNALRNKYTTLLQKATYVPKWLIEKTQADNNAVASISFVAVPYTSIVDSTVKVSDDEIMDYAKKHHKEFDKEEETRTVNFVSFDAKPSSTDSATTLATISALKSDFIATTDVNSYLGKVGSELQFYDSYLSKTKIQQSKKDSIVSLSVGQTFGPYLDQNNYVIAKMIAIKQWPDSTKVRHILISTADPRSGQQIKADSVAKKQIDSIETVIKGGANFEALCLQFSDDAGSKTKGGVYDYFPQGQMVPSFNEFAFDKPVGSKGIVKTDYGYHYIEVLGQKNNQPAYKIAYLAKPIVASSETISAASTAAAQFSASSKNKKAFDENVVAKNLLAMPSGEIKTNDNTINGIGNSRQLVRWVYEKNVGDISESFEVGDKYIVALLSDITKPGLPKVNILKPQIEQIVRNQKKAKQIVETKFKGTTLEALASSTGTTVNKADSVLFSNPFIPGIGLENKVSGAAFNASQKGKASEPIVGTNGVYAIRVENISNKPNTSDINAVKQQLLQAQSMAIYRANGVLRKAATIKDNRSKVY